MLDHTLPHDPRSLLELAQRIAHVPDPKSKPKAKGKTLELGPIHLERRGEPDEPPRWLANVGGIVRVLEYISDLDALLVDEGFPLKVTRDDIVDMLHASQDAGDMVAALLCKMALHGRPEEMRRTADMVVRSAISTERRNAKMAEEIAKTGPSLGEPLPASETSDGDDW